METSARSLPCPTLISMSEGGSAAPGLLGRLEALGYRIVIVPSDR